MTDVAHWVVVALFVLLLAAAAGVDVVRRKILRTGPSGA